MEDLKEKARQILDSAINAVKPEKLITEKIGLSSNILKIDKYEISLGEYRKIYMIGAGKAAAFMAREMEAVLGDRIAGGVVCVKYGHTVPCRFVQVMEAGHPVVDQNGLNATAEIMKIAKRCGKNDLVLCLLSGGGSALLELLPEGIGLKDLQQTFDLLLRCGANIEEINTIRRHLSLVKGGRLAKVMAPAACVSIIISDVIGDPLEAIASGPTAPDPTTFEDAWDVIQKHGLEHDLPELIRAYLRSGLSDSKNESLKASDPVFENVHNLIIGNNFDALNAARQKAEELGFNPLILTGRLQGEAREAAKVMAAIAKEIIYSELPVKKPACTLAGGETTVTLRGNGKGGRNQELALAFLIEMKNVKDKFVLVSCGTDGADGPTDAAGGMITHETGKMVKTKNLNLQDYLEENDSYSALKELDALIRTGPTGTNVMDIIFMLIP